MPMSIPIPMRPFSVMVLAIAIAPIVGCSRRRPADRDRPARRPIRGRAVLEINERLPEPVTAP